MESYIDSVMLGMTLTALISLVIVALIYFPQKKLKNTTTLLFGVIIVVAIINTMLDSVLYIMGIRFKYIVYAVFNVASLAYVITAIVALNLLTVYCYLMTYCKHRKISKSFAWCSSIPVIVSIVQFILWAFDGTLIKIDDTGAGITTSTYGLVMCNYVIYSIISIGLMLLFREKSKSKYVIITNVLGVAQGIILIWVAKTQYLLVESTMLMIDIILLYILVQNPKNRVDVDLGCYDKNALQTILLNYESQMKDYYIFTVDVVDINYYVGKYGLETTEKILKKVVASLPQDTVKTTKYRFDSDIFVILTTSEKDFEALREFWQRNIKTIWHIDGKKIKISFVITEYFKDHKAQEGDMLAFLNKIMSFEKKQKGSRYVRIEDRKEMIERESLVLNALTKAIDDNSFEVYYQPIYDVNQKCFNKAEALARLSDDKAGFIPPDEFIRVAEDNSIIREVTKCIINKSLETLKNEEFIKTGIKTININLSTLELSDIDTFIYLRGELKKYGLSPESITLEVTETADLEAASDLVQSVQVFHDYGFKMALDDYGTGFSNMERILSMPFNYIKIDKTMVQMSGENMNKRIMLQKNIEMLKGCGYLIVVEGVENEAQAEEVIRMGADYIQGFYYAKPMPFNELIKSFQ